MDHQPQIGSVGIMSPGDMGHAIGGALREHGLDVIACTSDRSERTQQLARSAGIRPIDSPAQFVAEADVILSILPPASAESAAEDLRLAIGAQQSAVHFVDCNAVSPETVRRIGETIHSAGGAFTDASIIGFPPGAAEPPRIYASGPHAGVVEALDGKGVVVKVVGKDIGQASALKMCYAALTKGTFALYFALAIVAQRRGLLEALLAELAESQSDAYQQMQQVLPRLPAKAWRWIEEMNQIASSFEEVDVTGGFHHAAAEVYRLVSETPLGRETPESIDMTRTFEATIAAIANASTD